MEIDDTNGGGGDDEAVGHGRPPRHTRWKKGQSGDPSGRPRGARGLKIDLRAELISKMEISMNGKRVSGTRHQLMLRTLTARAAAGDVRATRILIDVVLQEFGPEDEGGGAKTLSRTDQQILDEVPAPVRGAGHRRCGGGEHAHRPRQQRGPRTGDRPVTDYSAEAGCTAATRAMCSTPSASRSRC